MNSHSDTTTVRDKVDDESSLIPNEVLLISPINPIGFVVDVHSLKESTMIEPSVKPDLIICMHVVVATI